MSTSAHDLLHQASYSEEAYQSACERLVQMGQRLTQPRREVLRVFSQTSQPLAVDEIIETLHQGRYLVHRATVYRTVEALAELEMLWVTSTPGGASAYHLAALPHAHNHIHVRCERCGDVSAVDMAVFEQLRESLAQATGVRLDPLRCDLVGACAQCSAEASPGE